MSAVRFVVVRLFVVVAVVAGGGVAGCQDPCVSLAERICNCEATANERRACIADRVTNQQSTTPVDDADRAFCAEKLDGDDPCSCEKLDNNDFEACGFANEPE
ncbi:MAG: hypothetical protein Q8O67_24990 [Deltaproteobacteria bacterium]|nr:hypothetical protein [Deltaproteobacteria bacterium]